MFKYLNSLLLKILHKPKVLLYYNPVPIIIVIVIVIITNIEIYVAT
jgi:hypothetical protein